MPNIARICAVWRRSLAEALIERAGIARDGEGRWFADDGRRTSAISEEVDLTRERRGR